MNPKLVVDLLICPTNNIIILVCCRNALKASASHLNIYVLKNSSAPIIKIDPAMFFPFNFQ